MTQSFTLPSELVLIANPVSGRGVTRRNANPVLRILRSQGFDVRAVLPKSAQQTKDFVASLPADTLVVCLGGDGFLHDVMEGCLVSGAIMAPLPGGRGNDLCRHLGLGTDPKVAAQNLPLARLRHLDVGYVNGVPYLGTACIGYDAFANKAANEAHYVKGPLVYPWGAFKTLITYQPLHFAMKTPQVEMEGHWSMIDIGDSGCYGGGMVACPGASMEDGKLDVVVWQEHSRMEIAMNLQAAYTGEHVNRCPHVYRGKAEWVEISTRETQPVPVYADGEEVAYLPARFEVHPGELKVLA